MDASKVRRLRPGHPIVGFLVHRLYSLPKIRDLIQPYRPAILGHHLFRPNRRWMGLLHRPDAPLQKRVGQVLRYHRLLR
jgi:hypothetical protein